MKIAVLSGVKQAVGIRMVIAILAIPVMILFSSTEKLLRVFPLFSLLPYGYHTDLIISALQSDTVAPFIPILAGLPFAASYVDDLKTKFARFFCIRTSYDTYIFSRIFVCFFCGGFVIVIGVLLSWGASALFFLPLEQAPGATSDSAETLVQMCGLLFLFGGLWAVVGMSMSTLMESKYIAYAAPFVMYYMLVILYERYFTSAFILYPLEWINPSNLWPFGNVGATVVMIEITLAFVVLFAAKAGRRLREL